MRFTNLALIVVLLTGCGSEPIAPNSNPIGSAPRRAAASDHERLQGRWKLVAAEIGGQNQPLEDPFDWVFSSREWKQFDVGDSIAGATGSFVLDEAVDPRTITIDVRPSEAGGDGAKIAGVYALEGDTLRVCYAYDAERPKSLQTEPGGNFILITMSREE